MSRDPIGLRGGLSAYAYVSDPTAWIDPLGLAGKPTAGADCSGAGGGASLLTEAQQARVGKIGEIAHNWKVRKTLSGELLDAGHVTKIQEGMAGLTKHRQALQKSLNNPKLSAEARVDLQDAADTATDLIDRANALLKGR